MEPRTRYRLYLFAGIVWLIVPVADRIKGIPASFGIGGFEIAPLFFAALFFGMAMKAKTQIPRLR
jgi:hypothetical protein